MLKASRRKQMVKLLRLFSLLVLVLGMTSLLSACDKNKGEKVILITDKGDITDKSFNQGAYEGVKEFCEANDIAYDYLKPADDSNAEYIAAIERAIQSGATTVVTPGYLFEPAINEVQHDYPNVKFILLDGNPANADNGTLESNVYSIFYAEEQVGFLAAYSAVKEGYRQLAFMGGMAVPAVQRYGHGFIQGADAAALELNLGNDSISIQYLYTGDFKDTPEVRAAAATFYNDGVEIIFGCGGSVGLAVMASAESANKKTIGVDVDQSGDSQTVITSAKKNLKGSVIQALEAIYKTGKWESDFGGKSVVLDASRDGVSLEMGNARFQNFKQADYDAVLAKLIDGSVEVSNVIGEFGGADRFCETLATDRVSVTYVPFGE
jgi:basic membrane protein A